LDPNNNGQTCADCAEPINASTGNVNQVVSDFSGNGAFPLSLVRYYNNASSSQTPISAFFFKNWRLNWDRQATYIALQSGGAAVNMERPDGKIIRFTQNADASWAPPINSNARLTEQKDGSGTTTGWLYYSAQSDQTEQYDAQGRLAWIQNRAGLRQTLTRSASTGQLSSVSDPFGRTLTFTYSDRQTLSSVTLPDGQIVSYAYASPSFGPQVLSQVTYPDGHSTTLLYDETAHTNGAFTQDFLTGVVDENGDRFQTYDYAGNTASSFLFSSWGQQTYEGTGANRTTFSYEPGNFPNSLPPSTTTVTDPLGSTHIYGFNSSSGKIDPSSISQSGAGSTPAGVSTSSYDTNGNLTSSTDFNGNLMCFQYDSARNLETTRLEGLPPGSVCPPDLSSYRAPPTLGSTIRKISTQWHPTWRLPTVIARPKRIDTMAYDGTGAPATISSQATTDTTGTLAFSAPTIGAPRTWTLLANAQGQITQVSGPRTDIAQTSTLTYYPSTTATHQQGDMASSTNALGQTTTFDSYDGAGRILQWTDPNGVQSSLSYTPRGWISSFTLSASDHSSSQVTQFAYDNAGNLTKTTFPDGAWISQTFDTAHRLTGQGNSAGESTTYTLDDAGNKTYTQMLDASQTPRFQATRVFNALSQLISATGLPGETTQWTYDAKGNTLSQTDALGNSSATYFDALNRPIAMDLPKADTTSPTPSTQTITDLADHLMVMVDPRQLVSSQTTDGLGNTQASQTPDSGSTASNFDAAGNISSSTDARGKTTNFSYDALNRIILASYQTGSPTTIQYDGGSSPQPNAIGKITYFSDESGHTSFSYDSFGRVASQSQTTFSPTTAAQTETVSWNYGATGVSNGNLSSLVLPSGATISYSYDSFGRVLSLDLTQPASMGGGTSSLLSNIAWTPMAQPQSWIWGNGSSYSRQFDLDGRISQYPLGVLAGTGTLSATPDALLRTVSYDLAGRITAFNHADASGSTTSSVALAANQSFSFDGQGRVTSFSPAATATLSAENYGYDLSGNRSIFGLGTQIYPFSVSPASNRLTNVASPGGPQSFSYDADGNLLSDGVRSWTYSDRGRMATFTNSTSENWGYFYSAQGFRTLKEGPSGQAIRFVRDKNGHLLGEYDASGNVLEEVVWLGDWPVAVLTPPSSGQAGLQIGYVFPDQIGAPRAVVRANDNALLWRWTKTDPFGRVEPEVNPQGAGNYNFDLRLPGQTHDTESGLDHNNFRDYDPALGRYIQPDPAGISTGFNGYSYTYSHPLSNSDQLGLVETPAFIIGIFAHQAFSVAVGKIPNDGTGTYQANTSLDSIFTGRPDAIFTPSSASSASIPGEDPIYDRNVWELKPDTWQNDRDPYRYGKGLDQLNGYCAVSSGTATPGGSDFIGKVCATLPPDCGVVIGINNQNYWIQFGPDRKNDSSGMVFYTAQETDQQPTKAYNYSWSWRQKTAVAVGAVGLGVALAAPAAGAAAGAGIGAAAAWVGTTLGGLGALSWAASQ